jgi:hypothetical protein
MNRIAPSRLKIFRPRSHALRGNAFQDALRPGLDHLDPSEFLAFDAERRGRHSHAERGNEGIRC